MPETQKTKQLWRALISLEGLAMGDAFGRNLFAFSPERLHHYYETRALPEAEDGYWSYTDNTQMALALVKTLCRYHAIDQDRFMASLIAHYEPGRAYGDGMCALREHMSPYHQTVENRARTSRETTAEEGEAYSELQDARDDQSAGTVFWRELIAAQFSGQGLFGNRAALLVAPLGAYFAGNSPRVVTQARLSATTTHTHPEAVAGAIAVAMAAALAWQYRASQQRPTCTEFLQHVLRFVPPGAVNRGLQLARELAPDTSAPTAASLLGRGSRASAQDTVPFVLWCAGQFLDDYEEALWQAASGLGDVDTICAIVGGIVVLYTGVEKIPEGWLRKRESLTTWALH